MILPWLTVYFSIILPTVTLVAGEAPLFRILAPEFICPKDKDTPIEKPDNTIITLQTAAGSDFDIVWTVRWAPLVRPSQRFTLMLWKTIRALETKLNAPQPEPYVYVIANDELLHGVNYEFTLSAVEGDGRVKSPKTFHIDNTQGDQKLDMVEGRADLMYVVLVGAQVTFADVEFELEAQVTSCFPTQDYHFVWTVRNTDNHDVVYVSPTNGSRLVIPPYSLKAGQEYDANCQVFKHSTGFRITQTSLPFQVLYRGLEVYLSVEYLILPVNQAFFVQPTVVNRDYYDSPVLFSWECTFAGMPCDFLESVDNDTLYFSDGLPELGEYEIKVIVNVRDQSAAASSVIKTVEHTLPVIQITPMSHILNEGTKVSLVANASNVAPTCTLTWYFAPEDYLCFNNDSNILNNTLEDCQHGVALSDTLTIFSLEENFLTELADFTNETEWRQVSGEMIAGSGRARFVAECGCSITFECETKGMVYADMSFALNESPKPGSLKVTPDTGTAMETLFRISTLAVMDNDTPLRYSFYCRIGEDDALLLGSFVDHLAVETLLPYVDGGTDVWVEVCDSLGACASGEPSTIVLDAGNGSTVDMLIENALGQIRRCEIHHLMTDVGSAIITYTGCPQNADQSQHLSKFTTAVLGTLPPDAACLHHHSHQYTSFLHWLASHGVDTGTLT